jgi:hypothetical protein
MNLFHQLEKTPRNSTKPDELLRLATTPVDVEPYALEKLIMTDREFEEMDWHDVQIHAIGLANEFPRRTELLMDLDYILRWVNPLPPREYFSYWLSPATLVFENVFKLDLNMQSEQLECQIDQINREPKVTRNGAVTSLWTLKLHQGEITFWSTGYTQYFRRHPVLHHKQHFIRDERGGLSFSRGMST